MQSFIWFTLRLAFLSNFKNYISPSPRFVNDEFCAWHGSKFQSRFWNLCRLNCRAIQPCSSVDSDCLVYHVKYFIKFSHFPRCWSWNFKWLNSLWKLCQAWQRMCLSTTRFVSRMQLFPCMDQSWATPELHRILTRSSEVLDEKSSVNFSFLSCGT